MPEKLIHGVIRPRLLANNRHYKLGLICAPAGYGKTTAIADWARTQTNIAWFNIDRFDDHVSQFYTYWIHALSQLKADTCPLSFAASKTKQFSDLITPFTHLINELSEFNQSVTLVLDNYQYIKNPIIHQGIAFFIKNMPEGWQVIISSRTTPPLPVSNLRIKQQLFEIDETKLAFTLSEADDFFSKCTDFSCDPEIQKILCQNVAGWPTALQLVSILSKDSNSFSECAKQIGQGNHPYLWDYLDEEVFSRLTESLQTLLVTIAPLNKFDADIINALCGTRDAQEQLDKLQKQGIFITANSNQQKWFTFRAFFKAFLLHKNQHATEITSTHKKIAQLWLSRNELEQALPHALISQDEQLLIDLLLETGWQLFNEGKLNNLGECFALIEDKIWAYPKLVLLKAWMLQSRQQSYLTLPLLEKAKMMFAKQGIILSPQQRNEFTIIHAQIAIAQGKADEALQQAQSILLSTQKNSTKVTVIAQAIIAEAHQYKGNLSFAYQCFQDVKQLADEQNLQQNVIWSLYQQAEILQAQNDHNNAQRHIDAAISLINKYQLQTLPLYIFLLHFKARQAYQQGDFKPAEYLCEHALKIALPYGQQWCLSTYTLQAKIAFAKNEPQQVTRLIAEIEKPLHNLHFYKNWVAAADDVRIQYWQANNDTSTIKLWLENHPHIEQAFNRFTQCHNRNRVRAFMQQGALQIAEQLLEKNINSAQQCGLRIELNRNLILLSCIKSRLKQFESAKKLLSQAIELSLQTELIICFARENNDLKSIYLALAKDASLNNACKEKLFNLLALSGISLHEAPKTPFNASSVVKIQAHPLAPRLIKNIHLTPREWQVMGFIYSDYRNQQMARAMGVAPTTVKSHIRNLYQKLGLENREEALALATLLVSLIDRD